MILIHCSFLVMDEISEGESEVLLESGRGHGPPRGVTILAVLQTYDITFRLE